MGLEEEEASNLHLKYYTTYGLALRGLTKHHDIGTSLHIKHPQHGTDLCDTPDPIDFDHKCDGMLPLEDMIFPNKRLVQLFRDIDRRKGARIDICLF